MTDMLPYRKTGGKAARIVTDQGANVVEVEEIDRRGNKLRVRGRLMGEFPTSLYISAEDSYRMVAMLLRPAPFVFALLSPFYWVKSYRRTHSGGSIMRALSKMLFLRVIPVCLIIAFVVAMVILGIYSLVV